MITSFLRRYLLILLLFIAAAGALAQSPSLALAEQDIAEPQAAHQVLEAEQRAIEQVGQELSVLAANLPRLLAELQDGQVNAALLEQARLDAEVARLRQEYLQLEFANTERRLRDLRQSTCTLEAREQLLKNPARAAVDGPAELQHIAQALAELRGQLDLALAHQENLRISGLLLLIERPLRSSDIVKIGPSEGTVSRIGIRSTTVKTFDDLEVIIPNAEVINSSFTNWTHSDNIIRSVIMVRVSHDDDPDRVRKLLTATVRNHPAVLQDPPPLALLWELADFSLLFRVQFYSDVTQANVLVVRSEIRSRIWYALQEAGVHVPYPQQDIHVREWPGEDLRERPSPEPRRPAVVQPFHREPAMEGIERGGKTS